MNENLYNSAVWEIDNGGVDFTSVARAAVKIFTRHVILPSDEPAARKEMLAKKYMVNARGLTDGELREFIMPDYSENDIEVYGPGRRIKYSAHRGRGTKDDDVGLNSAIGRFGDYLDENGIRYKVNTTYFDRFGLE